MNENETDVEDRLQEQVTNELNSDPIVCLGDIARLYSLISLYNEVKEIHKYSNESNSAIESGSKLISEVIGFEDLRYLTPNMESEFLSDSAKDDSRDWNVISLRVDLSDRNNPKLADDPIVKSELTKRDRHILAHSRPDKPTGQGDFSVTHYTGTSGINAHKLAGRRSGYHGRPNLVDRLTHWPNGNNEEETELVSKFKDEHDERNVIKSLQELGRKDGIQQRIENAVLNSFTINKSFKQTDLGTCFITIQVKLEDSGSYLWPGQVPEISKLGAEMKKEKFKQGLSKTEGSIGDGVDYLSNKKGEVSGGTNVMLNMYNKKKFSTFPDLKPEESWRNRPFNTETSISFSTASSILEKYKTRFSSPSVSVYYLPHPKKCADYDKFKTFYDFVKNNSDPNIFSKTGGEYGRYTEYQIYNIIVWESNDPPVILKEIRDINKSPFRSFISELSSIIELSTDVQSKFITSGKKLANKNSDSDTWSLLHGFDKSTLRKQILSSVQSLPDSDSEDSILTGSLFSRHMYNSGSEYTDKYEAGTGTHPLAVHFNLLTGKRTDLQKLRSEFLKSLKSTQKSGNNYMLQLKVYEQYILLCALSQSSLSTEPKFIRNKKISEDMSDLDRTERLDLFIEEHPVLNDPEFKAVFALGGLIGRLSRYQMSNGVSTTIDEQYPIDSVNSSRLKRIASNAIEKNRTYASRDDYPNMNERYTQIIMDSMLSASDPSAYDIAVDDLQWIYAFGLTYGFQDSRDDNKQGDKNE